MLVDITAGTTSAFRVWVGNTALPFHTLSNAARAASYAQLALNRGASPQDVVRAMLEASLSPKVSP